MEKRYEKVWNHRGHTCAVIIDPQFAHRCGYVMVDDDSPLHGIGYGNEPLSDVCVHGGLTFSDMIAINGGEGWAFGFDCLHAGDMPDIAAAAEAYGRDFDEMYDMVKRSHLFLGGHLWTLAEVVSETESLCNQIIELERNTGR